MLGITLISVPAWGSVTIIEFIWFLVGIAVSTISLWNLIDVSRDLALSSIPDKKSIYVLAWGYVRREVLRLAQGLCIFTIGVVAMAQEAIGPNATTITGLVLTFGLFVIGLICGAQSYFDRVDRRTVEKILSQSQFP